MAFGLAIGTERATALENSIQDELTKRGFSADADQVMAEYITIMIINNKTPEQISSELEDLIGSDFDRSFTDWLFTEAAKGAPDSEAPVAQAPPSATPASSEQAPNREAPPHIANNNPRQPPNGPRQGPPLYQQALSQISTSGQKRSASARSPSPAGHPPNKSRRTEPPSGPRAMSGSRSLLDRMGGRAGPGRNANGRMNDEIQARIDNITANSPEPGMMGAFPNGMNGMDMNAMAMNNPMVLQEMMMSQMALMAQMAGAMGMLNPGVMNGGGFPGMPVGMAPEMLAQMQGMQGQPQQMGMNNGPAQRGGRPMRGRGGKRGGFTGPADGGASQASSESPATSAPSIVAPTPQLATSAVPAAVLASGPIPSTSASSAATTASRAGFVAPERPQSPTLCKFGLKCTNALCRYSHPSPVATPESGVVLSNEACENGRNCKDKDCIKAHVSPATLTAPESIKPKPHIPAPLTTHAHIPCKFGLNCARMATGCPYLHPPRPASDKGHFAQQCRFGSGCTRATCPFQHPEGRVLPNSFHKGLSSSAPMVSVQAPETGSIGAPSPHKSVMFNKTSTPTPTTAEGLQKRMKELEEMKSQAEAAIKQSEAAVANKKDENKPVAAVSS
ncbi:hypothetical protein OE88DRAFT_1808583 [Heliocybe sulcata]|uniref:Nab2 type CCCH zinc finger 4 domain-containing protein n=1 Tax=Heliocybe sulcata TaxID=5364 RepID=A0A5C3N1L7_9AGAM|nr:hypothetical protein OE88DRAFT_1808583 [Heliocybe sulcata]